MIRKEILSDTDCKKLALKIRNDFFKPVSRFKTTIFLCGADIKLENKIRYQIFKILTCFRYSFYYDIILPEDIFDELLYTSKSSDLISLENLLADSVDAIIIIPESAGSFSELGVFACDEKLRKKIICLIDEKYKKDKSFINLGPLKLVKGTNREGVIYIDPNNIEEKMSALFSALRKVKRNSDKDIDKVSLLDLDNFLLSTIYLLEPVAKDTLEKIVANVTNDEANSFQTTTSALTILIKKREIELSSQKYRLTNLGIEKFLSLKKMSARIKSLEETVALDNLRLEIFNLRYRNKQMKV
jgi:hypothetical protein